MLASLSTTIAEGQVVLGRQAVVPVGKPTAADMTPEETLVRTAYAKFSYASEQEVIADMANEAFGVKPGSPEAHTSATYDQRLAAAQVTFKLGDFVVGNLSDIVNRKAIDLVSPPVGEMLTAATPVHSFSAEGGSTTLYSVQPHWETASATAPEVLNATLGELHEMEWRGQAPTTTWQRYASYSITVTFQGKNRGPYKALFIFGHDAKGNAMVMPEDGTTDSTALATVLAVRLFPETLVRTAIRANPMVSNWLSASQKSGPACSRGQGDVCCDLIQLQCGPGGEDIADALSKPLPRP